MAIDNEHKNLRTKHRLYMLIFFTRYGKTLRIPQTMPIQIAHHALGLHKIEISLYFTVNIPVTKTELLF